MSLMRFVQIQTNIILASFRSALMCLASGVVRFQLFVALQNSLFCCLILQTSVSYHIILMYHLNYEHTGL